MDTRGSASARTIHWIRPSPSEVFFFFLRIGRPPRSPLFPTPPLSRSGVRGTGGGEGAPPRAAARPPGGRPRPRGGGTCRSPATPRVGTTPPPPGRPPAPTSPTWA